MRTLFMLLEGFYSAEDNVTIVLTKHFDLLYNNDCLAGSKANITVLGSWQVLSADVP